jgi:cytochrome c oxidase subunit 1
VTSAFFIGSIFTPWALPVAIVPLAVTLVGWFWPKDTREQPRQVDVSQQREVA